MSKPVVLPQHIIEKMSAKDRKELGLKTMAEKEESIDAASEAQIQSEVEAWLRLNGFWPRSDAYLDGKKPPKGWYFHLNKAKRNPIMLDLLIMALDGRCLELELKTATGPVRPYQKSILETTACATMARSTLEAIEKIKEWLK